MKSLIMFLFIIFGVPFLLFYIKYLLSSDEGKKEMLEDKGDDFLDMY